MAFGLNPYISFGHNAREAMTFYQTVFGGELTMATFGEYHTVEPGNPAADEIMHSQLKTDLGFVFMAADTPPGMPERQGSQITMAIMASAADLEAAQGYFTKLADGGSVGQPLEKQIWGDTYGDLTDRFGIAWMFNIGDQG